MLTQERLKELLDYNQETGEFKWLAPSGPRVKVGDAAGKPRNDRYSQIRIDTIKYQAHRIAWLYVTGKWPSCFIDHLNEVKSDNRFCNLRDVSNKDNCQNVLRISKNNKTGFVGVSKVGNKYIAKIGVSYKNRYLGIYETPEEASAVYKNAKRYLHNIPATRLYAQP